MLCAIGATSGLGLEALKLLVQQSHATSRIIISARSAATGSAAVQQVTTEKNEVTSLSLDLASFASVRSFAEQLKQSGEAIDVLLLNAAVYKTDLVLKAGWSEEAVVNHFCTSLALVRATSALADHVSPENSPTLPPSPTLTSSRTSCTRRHLTPHHFRLFRPPELGQIARWALFHFPFVRLSLTSAVQPPSDQH